MLWIVWALMLIGHGAFARWVETVRGGYAKVAVLQGMAFVDMLRLGLFFVAFGAAGRQLMSSALRRDLRSE